ETDCERDDADQNEAESPNRIEVEPASRYMLQAEIAVDQPRRASASREHCHGMDNGNDDRHSEICIRKDRGRFMVLLEAGALTKTEIDRNEHQASAMRDRYHERPKRQLRRLDSREQARMTRIEQPQDAKGDDQEAGTGLDLMLKPNERQKHREWQKHYKHCQQMACR